MKQSSITMLFVSLFLLAALLGCSANKSVCSHDDDIIDPVEPALLLSQVNVSMVPGKLVTVTIMSTETEFDASLCQVTCNDPSVANIEHDDNLIEITGVDFGTAAVTVTSNSGLTRDIPVLVYDPTILDVGELYIKYVDSFEFRWNDGGSGGSNDGSFFHPITDDEYYPLGSIGLGPNGYPNPNRNFPAVVVKAKDGSDALVNPIDYELIYNDLGSGANNDGSFWRPIPPQGYVALGVVVARGYNKPPLDDIVCVREDLTTPGKAGRFIYNDDETGANMDIGVWQITNPTAGPHLSAYLPAGTVIAWSYWHPPSADPVMNVLRVNLPMLAEAPEQNYRPQLTSFDTPPAETVPLMAKVMLVPFTLVMDSIHIDDMHWQIENTPFYRLERQVFHKLIFQSQNFSSETQHNHVEIKSGVVTTESESFWRETGISVTVEGGVSIKDVFNSSVSVTVSTSFGYQSSTSVSELQEKTVVTAANTPPGKTTALWQQYNKYVLIRHNEDRFEPVAAWDFGIDSYIIDEYPD